MSFFITIVKSMIYFRSSAERGELKQSNKLVFRRGTENTFFICKEDRKRIFSFGIFPDRRQVFREGIRQSKVEVCELRNVCGLFRFFPKSGITS